MTTPSLGRLFLLFAMFSLIAVGGGNAVVPEMQRQVVDLNHWMSGPQFVGLFAIAQASPGPNMLISSLVGWRMAGLPGALVCTLGMCLPSSLLAFSVARLWSRISGSPWRPAIEQGLTPVTLGLVLASGWQLAKGAGSDWRCYTLSAAVALLTLRSKLNPLWLLAVGGALGLLGWVRVPGS
ncbi:MAG: chromate transporter [Holophaga sp.]|nr:chromate transporter [Holophaga sp.]